MPVRLESEGRLGIDVGGGIICDEGGWTMCGVLGNEGSGRGRAFGLRSAVRQ